MTVVSKRFGGLKLNFRRPRKRVRTTSAQEKERRRLIQEFIQKNGVTRLPAGYSHVDW